MLAPIAHARIARKTNSGPLSLLRWRGAPRKLASFDRHWITRAERMLLPKSIARHSRVCSSGSWSMPSTPIWNVIR